MNNLNLTELSQVSGGEDTLLSSTIMNTTDAPEPSAEKVFNPCSNFTLIETSEDGLSSTYIFRYAN